MKDYLIDESKEYRQDALKRAFKKYGYNSLITNLNILKSNSKNKNPKNYEKYKRDIYYVKKLEGKGMSKIDKIIHQIKKREESLKKKERIFDNKYPILSGKGNDKLKMTYPCKLCKKYTPYQLNKDKLCPSCFIQHTPPPPLHLKPNYPNNNQQIMSSNIKHIYPCDKCKKYSQNVKKKGQLCEKCIQNEFDNLQKKLAKLHVKMN